MITLFILSVSFLSAASTESWWSLKFDYAYRGVNSIDIGTSILIECEKPSEVFAYFPGIFVSPFAVFDMEIRGKEPVVGLKAGVDISVIFAGVRLSGFYFDSENKGIIVEAGLSALSVLTLYGGVVYRSFSPLKFQISIGTNLPFEFFTRLRG